MNAGTIATYNRATAKRHARQAKAAVVAFIALLAAGAYFLGTPVF